MANMTFKARLLPAVNDSTEYTLGSTAVGWQYYGKISINSKSTPSSNTSYLIPILDSNSTTMSSLNSHSSLRYWLFTDGGGALALGTNTAAGDLILYSGLASNKYIQLSPPTSMSSTWRHIYLPDKDGTVALTSDLSGYSTTSHTHSTYVLKAGDTMTGTLTTSGSLISDRTGAGEGHCEARSDAGRIYLYSLRSTTGNRGIYGVNASGTSQSMFSWTQDGKIYAGGALYGAVWNDYAEFRKENPEEKESQTPGHCVRELGNGVLALTTKRLERGCEIVSDTYGFAIGEDKDNGYTVPIASTGRVLAYPYESIEEFAAHIGWPVCSGPDGTVSIMTEEEEEKYSSRIIGTISEIPDYEEWGSGNVKVNGRIWIRIR